MHVRTQVLVHTLVQYVHSEYMRTYIHTTQKDTVHILLYSTTVDTVVSKQQTTQVLRTYNGVFARTEQPAHCGSRRQKHLEQG